MSSDRGTWRIRSRQIASVFQIFDHSIPPPPEQLGRISIVGECMSALEFEPLHLRPSRSRAPHPRFLEFSADLVAAQIDLHQATVHATAAPGSHSPFGHGSRSCATAPDHYDCERNDVRPGLQCKLGVGFHFRRTTPTSAWKGESI